MVLYRYLSVRGLDFETPMERIPVYEIRALFLHGKMVRLIDAKKMMDQRPF